MPQELPQERRSQPRISGRTLVVRLRLKGKINRFPVQVVDFSRHGLGVVTDRPLPKDQLVYLSLEHPGARTEPLMTLERVIGVVHNCLNHAEGYRCGIRFRTESTLQFDRHHVEASLDEIERRLEQQSGFSDSAEGS